MPKLQDLENWNIPIDEWEPEIWDSQTERKKTGCGSLYITLMFKDKDKIAQIILHSSSKKLICNTSNGALADSVSFSLTHVRHAESEHNTICKNLVGYQCIHYLPNKPGVRSCSDALGKTLKKILKVK